MIHLIKSVSRMFLAGLLLMIAIPNLSAQDDDLRTIEFDIPRDAFEVEIELTIEDDDVSVLFHVVSDDDETWLGLYELYDEDDNLLYSIDVEENDINFGFYPDTEDAIGELGVFFPSAPQYNLDAGTYYLIFGAEDGGAIESITAIIRSGDVDGRQALDINLWNLSEESGLDSAAAQSDFEDVMRGHIDDLMNPHDLELGDLNFFEASDSDLDDFSAPYLDEFDIEDLNDLCETMSEDVGADRALNLAVVDFFDDDSGDTAGISVSAGNAGVIFIEGSRHSCVVVSWDAYADDLVSQAANIIHEAAHFMSIPHTTEAEGDFFDIFDDTPECAYDDFETDDDGVVDDFECGIDGGAKNFMFWNGDPEAGLTPYTMSDDQAWVLRRHPLFYATTR